MSRSWIKVGAFALGLSALVPAFAWADTRSEAAVAESRKGEKGEREKKFPMDGAAFKERVESRIAKVKERITHGMEKHNVPEAKRKEILADFEKGATRIRTAADSAAKDGTVTKDEAKQVREVAKQVRQEAREKYGKQGKGKGHGKGHGKGKGKDKADA